MRRTFTQIKLDDFGSTRNVVVLYDEVPCDVGTTLYENRQILFLRYISDDIRLITPGDSVFDTLQIAHSGNGWVATAISITWKVNTEK
jgi:hypothetical protein